MMNREMTQQELVMMKYFNEEIMAEGDEVVGVELHESGCSTVYMRCDGKPIQREFSVYMCNKIFRLSAEGK